MNYLHRDILIIAFVLLGFITNHQKINCDCSIQGDHQSTESDYLINELPQEKLNLWKTPMDEKLIVRLPSNSLLKYTSYKDVSILHFIVPSDTRTAFFTFKAFEESKGTFQRKCKPRAVTLYLKAKSYPVISPENITFPKNFLNPDERCKIYNLQFESNEVQHRIRVNGPEVGNWFAVAFVSWTDPNNDRIEQQGLGASCETLLLAEMSVLHFDPIIIISGQVHNNTLMSSSSEQINTQTQNGSQNSYSSNSSYSISPSTLPYIHTSTKSTVTTVKSKQKSQTLSFTKVDPPNTKNNCSENKEILYKFYVPSNIGVARALITITHVCMQCPNVGFYIQANSYPRTEILKDEETNYIHRTIIKSNQTDHISVEFNVQPRSWHYALLKFVSEVGESLDPLAMLNNLTISESSLQSGEDSSTFTYVQRQQHLQREQNQQFERRKKNEGLSIINSTICYQFKYALQIDFQKLTNTKNDTDEVDADKISSIYSVSSDSKEDNSNKNWQPVLFRNIEFYPLLRQTYREFFMFDYDLLPDTNGTVPTLLNLTAGTPVGFSFEVGDVYDIGGTLSFAVSMKHGLKSANNIKSPPVMTPATERSGILAEKLVGVPIGTSYTDLADRTDEALPRSNQTIIVCMHLGEPGEPRWPDKCRYGRKILPASSIVNNTDSNTSTGVIHVPFPESGQWYVTMGMYCHGAETAARVTIIDSVKEFVKKHADMIDTMAQPCACANSARRYQTCLLNQKCLTAMNETEILKVKECLMDAKCTAKYAEMTQKFQTHHKFATEQRFALDNCNTSVVFTISSSACVVGRCGRFGRCYHYMSGGFVFSTCVCMKGYRGWDCTDDTQVPSSMSILLASLLLTLSNLLFFPSIYMALQRKYYTEAVIYFFAMFFSIFYHACDSGEDEYSFCLVKIGVLQFSDFYCGLLAIWVTLVAMSHVRAEFVSLLHMLGAILLAFGTELNKQSLWVFLAPSLTGICLISISWSLRCYKSHNWFPARKYLTVYMPLGAVLVMVGLVCYAFLQTKQNYHIVHSIWHMVMALSILCLLPSRKSFIPKC